MVCSPYLRCQMPRSPLAAPLGDMLSLRARPRKKVDSINCRGVWPFVLPHPCRNFCSIEKGPIAGLGFASNLVDAGTVLVDMGIRAEEALRIRSLHPRWQLARGHGSLRPAIVDTIRKA